MICTSRLCRGQVTADQDERARERGEITPAKICFTKELSPGESSVLETGVGRFLEQRNLRKSRLLRPLSNLRGEATDVRDLLWTQLPEEESVEESIAHECVPSKDDDLSY
ncbi:hypothetical protein KIN20_008776 [Parelaphostrongylus tenuis]|uniref:Uncharacterized protein n=1 Tax=Parelaphostrongylus tenuis TaxID=148309 RepID=A0AAD5MN88_PARTN|nr:hypothetical protein KIN20_008776 [Parelaphostrongylus tenuis]